MVWMKVSDKFHAHAKVIKLMHEDGGSKRQAFALWLVAGSWCSDQLTDGFVPDYVAQQWDHDGTSADALVAAGLWEMTDGGFRFHDWLDCNPSAEDVVILKQKRSEAGRVGGLVKQKPSKSQASASPLLTTCASKTEPRPIPDPTHTQSQINTEQERARAKGSSKSKPVMVPMPDEWEPSRSNAELAKSLGMDVAAEADDFRDWTSARGQRYADWHRAFASHLRRAAQRPRPGVGRQPAPGYRREGYNPRNGPSREGDDPDADARWQADLKKEYAEILREQAAANREHPPRLEILRGDLDAAKNAYGDPAEPTSSAVSSSTMSKAKAAIATVGHRMPSSWSIEQRQAKAKRDLADWIAEEERKSQLADEDTGT